MALCLVTGGGGFIGSHLVDGLLAASHEVRVLDNWSTGSRANLAHVREHIEIISGDVTDGAVVCQAMKGVELVFHLAAPPYSLHGHVDPLATHRAGSTGTLHVLIAARDAKEPAFSPARYDSTAHLIGVAIQYRR